MRIDWTRSAFADLNRAREDIRQFIPAVAQMAVMMIEADIKNLPRLPEMGRVGEEPGTRELIIRCLPYFMVYRVKDDAVQILRVLHDRQKWPTES